MKWIHHYQLFLFDFDGLLVNTEALHYQAYQRMCKNRGFELKWSFKRYSEAAHHHATGLRDSLYAEFPALHLQEPDWNILYEEKKTAFLHLLKEKPVPLMPGVASLLSALEKAAISRCVVTHSPLSLIQIIREQNPLLDTIPNWISREDYTHPKPHAECYQIAIQRFAKKGNHIIGFEDSPRGLNALLQTSAKAVLICPADSSYLDQVLTPHLKYYPSFEAITDENYP